MAAPVTAPTPTPIAVELCADAIEGSMTMAASKASAVK